MKLVACSSCHTQYDVTHVSKKFISCRCGEQVENRDLTGVDAQVRRCGSCGAQVQGESESCAYCGSAIVPDDASLSLICPECFGRNAEDARFCTACGVGFSPEKVPVEGEELPCPCCGALMAVREVGGIGINECAGCNGLWVPEQRLDLLVAKAVEARDANPQALAGLSPRVKGHNPAAQSVQYRKCPVCEAFMARRNFEKSSGVIIDLCNDHGTFLDADELERIAGFLVTGGRPTSSANLAAQAEGAREAVVRARIAEIAATHGSSRSVRFETGGSSGNAGGLVGTLFRLIDGFLD